MKSKLFLLFFILLIFLLCCSCKERSENMYFLANNNGFGALTVYRCDGEQYYEAWSHDDGANYVRFLDGDTLYYAPVSAEGSELCSVNLKTGEDSPIGRVPDGIVKQIAAGEKGVYATIIFTESQNDGLYRISSGEPELIASCVNSSSKTFVCHDGGVYYFIGADLSGAEKTSRGIMRYDEKSGETQEIIEYKGERNLFIDSDGDCICRSYFLDEPNPEPYPKTPVSVAYLELYNTKTGETQTIRDAFPDGDTPVYVHDGWLYSYRSIETPFEDWDFPDGDGDFFIRRSLKTGKEEILGPVASHTIALSDCITFGRKGFVLSDYIFSEEYAGGGRPVYYYYPFGTTERIELSFVDISD